jgi:Carbohydrate family 9 binding domain-like
MKYTVILFVVVAFASCVQIKKLDLYDQNLANDDSVSKLNLSLPIVFSDQVTSEVWYTKSINCLQVNAEKEKVYSGDGSIRITWNKQAGDCSWIGMGIGWGNWTGKDLQAVESSAALSFHVRTDQGEFSGLPWAMCLEDFSGAQAWLGLTGKYVKGGKVTTDWNEFVIPLADFSFENWNMDGSSVKQLIFQFESSGTVYIDEIEIVPYSAPSKPTLTLSAQQAGKLDGIVFPNEYAGYVQVSMGTLHVNYDSEYVYFGLVNSDRTTPVNNQKGRDIWNGDAMEIAFSTESNLLASRPFLYDSDKHLGIQLAPPYSCFDWNSNKEIPAEVVSKISEKDQVVEVKIKWADLKTNPWKIGGNYNFEFALDLALSSDKRDQQLRWSAVSDDNFYNKPATWGVLNIVPLK